MGCLFSYEFLLYRGWWYVFGLILIGLCDLELVIHFALLDRQTIAQWLHVDPNAGQAGRWSAWLLPLLRHFCFAFQWHVGGPMACIVIFLVSLVGFCIDLGCFIAFLNILYGSQFLLISPDISPIFWRSYSVSLLFKIFSRAHISLLISPNISSIFWRSYSVSLPF